MARALILRAPGTNCDAETAYAFEQAGAQAQRVHINRLLEQGAKRLADDYQIVCIPGGFSYGDDVAAGRILANQIRHHLGDVLSGFKDAGGLILGICNGFQVLIKTGLLLDDDPQHGPAATLTWNTSGRFEDRWVRLAVEPGKSVFLSGIESLYLPIAHAEGRFVTRDKNVLASLQQAGQLPLRYIDNPNGSDGDVAGVCDATGRVLGLMPHPERYIDRTQHPRWTRGEGTDPGEGLRIFQNAVNHFGV